MAVAGKVHAAVTALGTGGAAMIGQMALQVTDGLQQRGWHAEPPLGCLGCASDRAAAGRVIGRGARVSGHAEGAEGGRSANDEQRSYYGRSGHRTRVAQPHPRPYRSSVNAHDDPVPQSASPGTGQRLPESVANPPLMPRPRPSRDTI